MAYIDDLKINNAVHECLDRCYRTDDVLPRIAEFLEELKAADWREAEIHEVELAVHKVLHGIVQNPIYPGDATNQPVANGGPTGSKASRVSGA